MATPETQINTDWIGPVAGFITGVASTIVTERINGWLNRPGIILEFEPDDQCLRVTNARVQSAERIWETESKYLRIKARNKKRFTAKGCRPFLTGVRQVNVNGKIEKIFEDTLPLRWAYLGFAPLDIAIGSHFYFDILSAVQGRDIFNMELEKTPFVLKGALRSAGHYIFDVLLAGDNFSPLRLSVHLDWKGDWDFEDVWKENTKS